MSTTTKENLQEKIRIICEFLKENYNIDISSEDGHELISKILDCKTCEKTSLPILIKTVNEMKKALERFDNSAIIDACYTFKRKELEDIELEQLDPEDEIYQEFSIILEDDSAKDIASFSLKLEHESITQYSESGFSGYSLE